MFMRNIIIATVVFTAGLLLGNWMTSAPAHTIISDNVRLTAKQQSATMSDNSHDYASYSQHAMDMLKTLSSMNPALTAEIKERVSSEVSQYIRSILSQSEHLAPMQTTSTAQQAQTHQSQPVRELGRENDPVSLLFGSLGMTNAAYGYLFNRYEPADRSSVLPFCFSAALEQPLHSLCPKFFPGSVAQRCKGMEGWTCVHGQAAASIRSQPVAVTKEREISGATGTVKQEGCGNEFAPVCCKANEIVHAVQNYCMCGNIGGTFVGPGSDCRVYVNVKV